MIFNAFKMVNKIKCINNKSSSFTFISDNGAQENNTYPQLSYNPNDMIKTKILFFIFLIVYVIWE